MQRDDQPVAKHRCHWPGCEVEVEPKLWGCKHHWYKLPERLRRMIWIEYRPGQETTKTPSAEYVAVANAVQEWIKGYLEMSAQRKIDRRRRRH